MRVKRMSYKALKFEARVGMIAIWVGLSLCTFISFLMIVTLLHGLYLMSFFIWMVLMLSLIAVLLIGIGVSQSKMMLEIRRLKK